MPHSWLPKLTQSTPTAFMAATMPRPWSIEDKSEGATKSPASVVRVLDLGKPSLSTLMHEWSTAKLSSR